ncbi:MAG: hypothetical protein B7Z72_05360, partial [Gemmatimonadetes bacterium 21-71-4]
MPQVPRPRQCADAEVADARDHRCADGLRIGVRDVHARQHDRAETPFAACADRLLTPVPDHLGSLLDLRGEQPFEVIPLDRRGQLNPGVALGAVELRRDQKVRLREALRPGEDRAAAAREQIPSLSATAAGDPIGIREREQDARGAIAIDRVGRAAELPPPARRRAHRGRRRARVDAG